LELKRETLDKAKNQQVVRVNKEVFMEIEQETL
jgi:hypothetical protein